MFYTQNYGKMFKYVLYKNDPDGRPNLKYPEKCQY